PDDRDPALFGERCRGRVHDTEPLFETVTVRELLIFLRTTHDLRIRVVDAVDPVLAHEDGVRVDLRGAQGGCRVAREERVAGTRCEDHHRAFLELVDRAAADVRLGDLGDGDGRL